MEKYIQNHPKISIGLSTTDPEVAKQSLKQGNIQLAFIDYELDLCLGTDLLQIIENKDTKAFIVTGNADLTADQMQAYPSFVSILFKPLSYQKFTPALSHFNGL